MEQSFKFMSIACENKMLSASPMLPITRLIVQEDTSASDSYGSLVQECLDGVPTAQRALFNRLLPYLKSAVRRYIWSETDVQDVLQEAFIRIFRNLDQFDQTKGQVHTWARKIAVNVAITEGIKESKRMSRLDSNSVTQEHEVYSDAHEHDVLRKLDLESLLQRLQLMPRINYNVLFLYAVDGYSHDEIAAMMDITAVMSRKRLSRAKQWIVSRFHLDGTELILKKSMSHEMD